MSRRRDLDRINPTCLDAEEIRRLSKAGWTHAMLAGRFNSTAQGIAVSLRDNRWFSDPTLRARWEARLPAMRAALRANIADRDS